MQTELSDKNPRLKTFRKDRGHIWAGATLLLIGALLLARESGVDFPSWLFTWPMVLITLGLFIGIRHRFNNPVPFILLAVGGIFLADRVSDDFNLRQYFWPIVLISAGLLFIFRPGSASCRPSRRRPGHYPGHGRQDSAGFAGEPVQATSMDNIDITAIFGGVKKNVISKHLQGGEIVTVMGGAEINLTQADFSGRIVLENTNFFGGTKLIIPPDWEVHSELVAIFGGVDDKRPPATQVNHDKVIFLEGTCIFGGVEIKSF